MYVEVNNIALTAFTNSGHIGYISRVIEVINENETAKTRLAKYLATLTTALNKENEDYKTSTKSLTTDEIEAADKLRDKYYNAIKTMIRGFIDSPVSEMATAATALNQVVKDYSVNTATQLYEESIELKSFIRDMREQSEYVTKLGLTVYLDSLEEQNTKVLNAIGERQAERRDIAVGASKINRAATDEQYRLLIKHANALDFIDWTDNGSSDLDTVIDNINVEIKYFKEQLLGQNASASTDDSSSTDNGDSSSSSDGSSSSDSGNGGSSSSGDSGSSSSGSGSGSSSSGDDDKELTL